MDNRNYFTMAIPALLLGVAYLQPINAAPAEDLPNVTGRMTITQQTFTVSGVVTDTNGEPIIGANVIEKGTTNGAVTDFDGKFSLSLQNKQSILVVTYIGYNCRRKFIPYRERTTLPGGRSATTPPRPSTSCAIGQRTGAAINTSMSPAP